jgi:hypothetical protein
VIPDSIIHDGGNNSVGAFDNIQSTFYNSTNPDCYIGIDAG